MEDRDTLSEAIRTGADKIAQGLLLIAQAITDYADRSEPPDYRAPTMPEIVTLENDD
jgi:hypothetical protein